MNGCLYFGCWRDSGHILVDPDGWPLRSRHPAVWPKVDDETFHIDGALAPRRVQGGPVCWKAMCGRTRAHYCGEAPQGQFLRHELPNGYTAIQWWDRQQGDTRPGSNSTILLEGSHDSAELIAALEAFFPSVRANLVRGGVQLVEVFP